MPQRVGNEISYEYKCRRIGSLESGGPSPAPAPAPVARTRSGPRPNCPRGDRARFLVCIARWVPPLFQATLANSTTAVICSVGVCVCGLLPCAPTDEPGVMCLFLGRCLAVGLKQIHVLHDASLGESEEAATKAAIREGER